MDLSKDTSRPGNEGVDFRKRDAVTVSQNIMVTHAQNITVTHFVNVISSESAMMKRRLCEVLNSKRLDEMDDRGRKFLHHFVDKLSLAVKQNVSGEMIVLESFLGELDSSDMGLLKEIVAANEELLYGNELLRFLNKI